MDDIMQGIENLVNEDENSHESEEGPYDLDNGDPNVKRIRDEVDEEK